MKSRPLIISLLLASIAVVSFLCLRRPDNDQLRIPQKSDNARLAEVRARVEPDLRQQLAQQGLPHGASTFIRIFKEEKLLELWLQPEPGQPFQQFRTYPVANWGSGTIGPKLKEGDGQAPEGFYAIPTSAMNPESDFHLSFDLGFPNHYDLHHRRTGSYLMVHGNQVSIGCYAMTDPVIEEIYLIVEAAHAAGQKSIPVHCFPFRMTDQRLAQVSAPGRAWLSFWKNLKTGHDLFEKNKTPPIASLDPTTATYSFKP